MWSVNDDVNRNGLPKIPVLHLDPVPASRRVVDHGADLDRPEDDGHDEVVLLRLRLRQLHNCGDADEGTMLI